jgi:hypothetical protein
MAVFVDYNSARATNAFKIRRALALPLYAFALLLSFLSDGLANLQPQ